MEDTLQQEKKEAINAGYRALNSLETARDDLSSAKDWGIWDMLGGGLISTMFKHSKMDSAKEHMENAKKDLESFGRELQDVNMFYNLDIQTGDFLSFADWFLDGLVVDWMVQKRIKQAAEQVEEAIWQVESIIKQLEKC